MKKWIARSLFVSLGVLLTLGLGSLTSCLLGTAASVHLGSEPRASQKDSLVPMFEALEAAAAAHKDLQNRVNSLASKARVLHERGDRLDAKSYAAEIEDLNDGIGRLRKAVTAVKSAMVRLEAELHKLGMYIAFSGKFEAWNSGFSAVITLDNALIESAQPLNSKGPLDPRNASTLLARPASILEKLAASSDELHVNFQVIGNTLEIFRQVPASMVTAPPSRVLGETWLEHEERTGHWGIADPEEPGAVFSSHSIYAIRDKDPAHLIWADEATVLDFLLGRVKGQDYPYVNSVNKPYCMRCHESRAGKHNFQWCRPANSKTMIDACNVLEKTAR